MTRRRHAHIHYHHHPMLVAFGALFVVPLQLAVWALIGLARFTAASAKLIARFVGDVTADIQRQRAAPDPEAWRTLPTCRQRPWAHNPKDPS